MGRFLAGVRLYLQEEKDEFKSGYFVEIDTVLQERSQKNPAFYKGTQLCKADRGTFRHAGEELLTTRSGCLCT